MSYRNILLERTKRNFTCKDNIKIDPKEIGRGSY